MGDYHLNFKVSFLIHSIFVLTFIIKVIFAAQNFRINCFKHLLFVAKANHIMIFPIMETT